MRRTLLVTNDFPPVVGGIQSYLDDYTRRLPADDLTVLASTPPEGPGAAADHDAALAFDVVRMPTRMLLPTPDVRARMQRVIRERAIETVWFGAAAPLGLLGRAARAAGASRVIVSTHGHEVGWSMIPGARLALRRIFREADVVTHISDYTLGRLRPFMPPGRQVLRLPSGVFAPYTSITTNILFFNKPENGQRPSEKLWFYRVDIPNGWNAFSKTRPFLPEHLSGCLSWWAKRTEIADEQEGSFKARAFDKAEILAGGVNLDLCGYANDETKVLSLDEAFRQYEAGYRALEKQIDKTLTNIRTLIGMPADTESE